MIIFCSIIENVFIINFQILVIFMKAIRIISFIINEIMIVSFIMKNTVITNFPTQFIFELIMLLTINFFGPILNFLILFCFIYLVLHSKTIKFPITFSLHLLILIFFQTIIHLLF